MYVHIDVEAERDLGIKRCALQRRAQRGGSCYAEAADGAIVDVCRRCFAVAHIDAARERARVGRDARVGNFHIVVPAVHEDRATTL